MVVCGQQSYVCPYVIKCMKYCIFWGYVVVFCGYFV